MRFSGFALFFVGCAAGRLQVDNEKPKGVQHKKNDKLKASLEAATKPEPTDKDEAVDMQDPVARALMAASSVYVNADIDKKLRIASQARDKAAVSSELARNKADQVHKEVVAQQGEASQVMAEAMKHEAIVAAGHNVAVNHDTMAAATDTIVKKNLKKEEQKAAAAAAAPKVAKPVDSPAVVALNKQLLDIQQELVGKEKDLKVQTELEEEKQSNAQSSKVLTSKLKKQTDDYQREADVAKQIAEEKSSMAAKSKKEEDVAEKKFEDSDAEEKEAAKFLSQTRKEVQVLQNKAKATQAKKIALQKDAASQRKKKAEVMKAHAMEEAAKAQKDVEAATQDEKQAADAAKEHKIETPEATEKVAAEPTSKATKEVAAEPKVKAVKLSSTKEKDVPLSEEAVRKLMEENANLKKEKEELESQLSRRKVKQEKDVFKQKLKNKLAVVDRHSKVVKGKKF